MYNKVKYFILISILLFGVTPVFAQGDDLPNTYVVDWAGITFRYADGWSVAENDEGSLYLTTGTAELFPDWYPPDLLDEYGVAQGDVAGVMQTLQFNPTATSIVFDPASIQTQIVGGQQLFTYEFTDSDRSGPFTMLLAAFAAPDGTIFTGNTYPLQGESLPANLREQALLSLASFEIQAAVSPNYVFEEPGIGVVLPDAWQVIVEDNGFVRFESDQTYVDPYWYYSDAVISLGAAGDVSSVLADIAESVGAPFDPAAVEVVDLNGRSVTTVSYNDTFANNNVDYTGMLAGILLDDGTIFAADIYPMWGSELTELDVVLDVIASAQSVATDASTEMDASAETSASTGTEWFDLDGMGLGFYYPPSWEVQAAEDGYPYLRSGSTDLNPYYVLPDEFAAHGIVAGNPGSAIMMLLRARGIDRGVNSVMFDVTTVDGRDVVSYSAFVQDGSVTYDTLFVAVEVENGAMVMAVASPTAGGTLTEGDAVLQMMASATSEG